ncbi:magnesium transporter MRS2-3-like [Gastrolobium bilobum]|uniref:magnesium transporter MRS2-3-like n=1 Tax=Gastrolobium bilobum TaxID=150636 RepID=UPI002AB14BBA|nr:magnesium transporter MRS2-3-like [Gastrolobium bilobum]
MERSEEVMRRRIRKKGSGARTWLVVDGGGNKETVEAGRQMIMKRTGLTARDLRILDPLLSQPSTIMGRERAMVINLEHIKAIITAKEVLLLNSRDPSVIPFVDELHSRILHHHSATPPPVFEDQDGMKILPFEFVALEACLEDTCTALENEAKILEQETHPALDKLTSKISTLNLERVRNVKSRLVALTARVRRVRDELEHLLDDDEDMAQLYLTYKLSQQQLENSSTSSMNDGDDMESQVLQPDINDRIPSDISLEFGGGSASDEDHQNAADYSTDQMFGASNGVGIEIKETQDGATYSAVTKKPDVQELEMLLEAYFVQIGGTLNKLSALRDYVEDTEDYINIRLDDKQNRLLQMAVKLGTADVLLNAFIGVTGIFGMNIHIELYDTGLPQFLGTIFGCTAVCLFLFMVSIAWYKRRRLLE